MMGAALHSPAEAPGQIAAIPHWFEETETGPALPTSSWSLQSPNLELNPSSSPAADGSPHFTSQAEPRGFLLCSTTQLLLLSPGAPSVSRAGIKVLFQPSNAAHHTGLLLGFTYSQPRLFIATFLMFLEIGVTNLPGFYNHCFSLLSVLTCRSRPLYTEAGRAHLIKFLCLVPG